MNYVCFIISVLFAFLQYWNWRLYISNLSDIILFHINQIVGQMNVVRILISEITLYDTLKITPLSISCFSGQWRGNCLEYFQHFVKWYGGKPQNIQGGNIYLYILNVHVSLLYTIRLFITIANFT